LHGLFLVSDLCVYVQADLRARQTSRVALEGIVVPVPARVARAARITLLMKAFRLLPQILIDQAFRNAQGNKHPVRDLGKAGLAVLRH
jgi:hypothetical protein